MALTDLMSMFRSATPAQVPVTPTVDNQTGMGATHQAPGTPGNLPKVPNELAQPQEVTQSDPLATFQDVWTPVESTAPSGQFNIDPTKLMEAANRIDFTKVVSPATLQRIAAGGEDGIKASLEAMQNMSAMSYAQSAQAAAKIVEKAVSDAEGRFAAQVPGLLKNQQVGDSLGTSNPALNNPAFAPVISALKSQMTQKHPQATVSEITAMVNGYLNEFAKAAVPQKAEVQAKVPGEMDWSSFL